MLHLDDMSSNVARKCISCNARFSHGTSWLTWDSRFCQICNHSNSQKPFYIILHAHLLLTTKQGAASRMPLWTPWLANAEPVEGCWRIAWGGRARNPNIDINWLYLQYIQLDTIGTSTCHPVINVLVAFFCVGLTNNHQQLSCALLHAENECNGIRSWDV
jgi:hypothetical protein